MKPKMSNSGSTRAKTVVSIGQCDADHSRISGMLEQHFEASVLAVDSLQSALDIAQQRRVDLFLVNRILDSSGNSGMDVIRNLKSNSQTSLIPVMLVSNFEDSQNQAVELGAVSGFGKAALDQTATVETVGRVLDSNSNP